MKKYFVLFFSVLLLSIFISSAQDQRIADSLINIYQNARQLSDSAYLELLYDLSYYHPNPDTALIFSDELIEFSSQKSNSLYRYRGLLQKGNALRLKGKFDEAADIFFQCATEAQKIDYKKGIGCAYTAIGDIYFSSKDHKNSLNYYHKAYLIFHTLQDSALLATITFNIGSQYLNMKTSDSALYYFNKSEIIYEKLRNHSGIAYSAGNKGLVYSLMQNYQQAEINLLKAIKLLQELKDMYPVASYQLGLAKIYKKNGEFKKAIEYAYDSYNSASEYGLAQQIRGACKLLSELFEATGDYKKALQFQLQYISLKDSIVNEQKIMQIANMRTEYEVAQKQTEIDLLKRKNQIRTIFSVSLAIIVLLVVTLLGILLANYTRNKALNKLLAEQKEELESQRDQLEEHKEELETQRDKLTELNQTKDRFFSIISHDLRGPVSSLHGFSVILKEYLDNQKYDSLTKLTEDLNDSINNVSSLLNNLLSWALSQQGRFPYSPAKILLSEIVGETVMNLSAMAIAKNINIVNEVPKKIYIHADKNSLMTVFLNLLNNAIKFSHKESNIHITAKSQNGYAEIKISDNGVGIPKEKLNDIFLLKGDKSTWGTDREKGTGLGLSLAYDFVIMNKGTISVESEVGKGTTFIVRIPVT